MQARASAKALGPHLPHVALNYYLNQEPGGAWVQRVLAQAEACASAEAERQRGHGVADSVPGEAKPRQAPHTPTATSSALMK